MAIIGLAKKIYQEPMAGVIYEYRRERYVLRHDRWFRVDIDGNWTKIDPPPEALRSWGFKKGND